VVAQPVLEQRVTLMGQGLGPLSDHAVLAHELQAGLAAGDHVQKVRVSPTVCHDPLFQIPHLLQRIDQIDDLVTDEAGLSSRKGLPEGGMELQARALVDLAPVLRPSLLPGPLRHPVVDEMRILFPIRIPEGMGVNRKGRRSGRRQVAGLDQEMCGTT